jgi:hypothetical protein
MRLIEQHLAKRSAIETHQGPEIVRFVGYAPW